MYKLDLYDTNRKLVTPANVQKQLHWIMQDAEKHIGKDVNKQSIQ